MVCTSDTPPADARKVPAWSIGPWIQGILIAAAGLLAFAPPARGVMMLVPVLPNGEGAALRIAAGSGVRVLGAGPLPGSLYVEGRLGALLGSAVSRGMVVLAGSYTGCSGSTVK